MTNLTWRRLPNGDRQATQHPIRLIKPLSKRQGEGSWLVKVPFGRDSNFEDGWLWTGVANPNYAEERGGTWLKGSSYNETRALVAEHLDYILSQIPADYGQAEVPEPAAGQPPEDIDPEDGRPAYRQIADDIRRQIESGELKPGDQVPSESALGERFGVTHMTVRQAIGVLREKRLVVAMQGRGVFVQYPPAFPLQNQADSGEATYTWVRCACGCGQMIQSPRVYAQGHDARHRDQLVDLLVGTGSVRERADRIQHLIDGLRGRG